MIRWILSLLCVLLIFSSTVPAWAQNTQAPEFTEELLQQGDEIARKAFEATDRGDFAEAEEYWTEIIEMFPTNPAAWSNRGILRLSQNKLDAALNDLNEAIALAPNAADPYLNRGIVYEAKKEWQKAIADYNRVLAIAPDDPLAYNNLGNAKAGQENWEEAIVDYQKAADLDPNFAFARANYALALYQTGKLKEAEQTIRNLVRKYPMFPDMRAALTAILWEQGQQGEAESNWVAAVGIDNRYQDLNWVKNNRRWPPLMVTALEKFLKID
ncbi:MAG: tetratricopeptide repeat protein [Oscillatoria sp. PMC 1068.18]|nr:tetratricopeptide repeat protein [Oscillatoria sp. PMC 1076.18]MEC4990268.1 tetratricopeptide repeat protein [Oscillatoria sp. PMC 1068.18]